MMEENSISLSIVREVDVYLAVSRGRELARRIGFNEIDRTRIEIVILELSRNLLVHAQGGWLKLNEIERNPLHGMEVIAEDQGPGIVDIELALRDGYSTTQTLGAGLPGVRRLMDEFDLQSAPGAGTMVRAIRWLPRGGRR